MAISGRRRLGIAVTAAVVAGALSVANVRATPAPDLPPVGADRLLASTLSALTHPFTISGEVSTHVDIGIPSVPSGVGGGSLGPIALAIGDQHFKVWRSPDGLRIAHLLDLGEQDLVANADEAWFWDSSSVSAVHVAIPTRPTDPAPIPSATDADLLAFAQRIIAATGPYADVSVEGTTVVAGQACYELVLTPTSTLTLIGRIAVSIDAQTRLPLQLQVFPRGSDEAALSGGFTSVSYDPIDPSMFAFTAPPGATVRQATDVVAAMSRHWTTSTSRPSPEAVRRIFGNGFDTRVAVELSTPLPREVAALLPYAGPLLSAITVERSGRTWLLVGPVPVTTLERDAATLP